MDKHQMKISLADLVFSISQATDLISPAVSGHQKRVAYITFHLARTMGMNVQRCNRLFLAGALHDMGALSLQERLDALAFEVQYPQTLRHGIVGAALLRTFPVLADIAPLIEYHHHTFAEHNHGVPFEACLLQMADRVDVLLDHRQPLLPQVRFVCQRITAKSGGMFDPEVVSGFMCLAEREAFWLDMSPGMLDRALREHYAPDKVDLDLDGLMGFARMFSQIIDFRSRFTTTHSSGVAATAEAMAILLQRPIEECRLLRVAGFLHDLGKLAIPVELLEKPAGLSREEYDLIRCHTFYTYRILETIGGMEELAGWAAFHHERLDGRGYPFHHNGDKLGLNARIMAVADVFTAISEDRPYRVGMDAPAIQRLLIRMSQNGSLDPQLVQLLLDNYERIDQVRQEAQAEAARAYQAFWTNLTELQSK